MNAADDESMRRMRDALTSKKSEVAVTNPRPVVGSNLAIVIAETNARDAAIAAGERIATMWPPGERDTRFQLLTVVSKEQARELLDLGATWEGPHDYYNPMHPRWG